MHRYVAPSLSASKFTCPFCGVYAQQVWSSGLWHQLSGTTSGEHVPIGRCLCVSCKAVSFWSSEAKVQIFPRSASGPMPHPDLPESCKGEYLEARDIAADSPRAAAALLRLCIQKLLIELGGKGQSIDADIGTLVSQGLPFEVKDALDVCRVVGNNAVHPGEISLQEEPELVGHLFNLINFIVRETIERKNTLKQLMAKLPEGALNAIERRDARALNARASPVPPSVP